MTAPRSRPLRARLKQKYGDTFFSGKPVFPPPVRWTVWRGQDTTEAGTPVCIGTGSLP